MRRRLIVLLVFLSALVPIAVGTVNAQTGTGNGQSRESPYPLGQAGNIGDYTVKVVSVTSDATSIVMQENQFNDPPAQGNVFFMVRVEATYLGSETGTPWIDLDFNVVGDQNRGYSESSSGCGVIPDEGYDAPELFQGGSAEFNACWSVPQAEAPSLVMYVEELFSFDSDRAWFALTESAAGTSVTSAPTFTPTAATVLNPPPSAQSVMVGSTTVSWTGVWLYDETSSMDQQATLNQVDRAGGTLKLVTYGEFEDSTVFSADQALQSFTDAFFQGAGATSIVETKSGQLDNGLVWKVYTFDLQGLRLTLLIAVRQSANATYEVSTVTGNSDQFADTLEQAKMDILLNGQPVFLEGIDPSAVLGPAT